MLQTKVGILGYELPFSQDKCKNFGDIAKIIAEQAPEELLAKLNQLPKDEFVDLMADIWLKVSGDLGLSKLDTGIDWKEELKDYQVSSKD